MKKEKVEKKCIQTHLLMTKFKAFEKKAENKGLTPSCYLRTLVYEDLKEGNDTKI